MGCDIHLYAEQKINGQWTEVQQDRPFYNAFYNGRNYELFAILAGVRNRFDLIPISMPRGLPTDISQSVKKKSDKWDSDGHSHSHLLLSEILSFDWTQEAELSGIVTPKEYFLWKRSRRHSPGTYCQARSRRSGIIELSEEEFKILIEKTVNSFPLFASEKCLAALEQLNRYQTRAKWKLSYSATVEKFLSETVPRLSSLLKGDLSQESLASVRIVFWFDN